VYIIMLMRMKFFHSQSKYAIAVLLRI